MFVHRSKAHCAVHLSIKLLTKLVAVMSLSAHPLWGPYQNLIPCPDMLPLLKGVPLSSNVWLVGMRKSASVAHWSRALSVSKRRLLQQRGAALTARMPLSCGTRMDSPLTSLRYCNCRRMGLCQQHVTCLPECLCCWLRRHRETPMYLKNEWNVWL